MIDLPGLWHGLGPETKAAVVGAIATLVAAAFGFGALIMQIRSQGRQSREAIAENERRKLKTAMYETSVDVCGDTDGAGIELSNQLMSMAFELKIASRAAAAGAGFDLPKTRFLKLLADYQSFSDGALKFVFLVENRRFIDPRLIVFRTAMSVVLHDTRNLMFSEFPAHVMRALPAEKADGSLFPYTPPDEHEVEKIVELADQFISALGDAQAYTQDFLVELQNMLMGDLFEVDIPIRVPADPARKVITLAHAVELETWFRHNTEWGRTASKAEAAAQARFAAAS